MKNNPSWFKDCGRDCPVENVNWYETLAFANALSQQAGLESCYEFSEGNGQNPGKGVEYKDVSFEGLDCKGYRLPTEAEWEYAARAGTSAPFWTGNNLTTDQVNYNGNYPYGDHTRSKYRQRHAKVRSFGENPWGLYEVHGNVREWVWDWYGTYSDKAQTDPLGPEQGEFRVLRGGGWKDRARSCRAANRLRADLRANDGTVGLRLVRTLH